MKVTAAIFRNGDNVLLMRRGADQPLAGEWEYPGGKFEDGEDGPTCLRRELFEELGIDAQIGDLITIAKHTTDSGKVIELHAYEILGYTGEIQLRVHDDMRWLLVADLPSHPQLPADLIVSCALAAHYGSPDHRNAIWDVTVKRLGQILPEKSADEILEFLNGRAGRHLADEILDGPGTLSCGVAMLNKLKMAKWWAYHTGTTPRPVTVDKCMLYRSAIKNEMRNRRIRKLVDGALACAQDDVWQTPEMWLKSDLTGLDELELMWGQIQQELKTKGAAHGND